MAKDEQISLNANKNDLGLLTSIKKQPSSELKIKMSGKKLCETDSVKYLGIQEIDLETPNWPYGKLNKTIKINWFNKLN